MLVCCFAGMKKKRKEKGERKKHKKDKNAPRRPQTAYFLWLNENRDRIKRENPGISVTEIAKKGGEEWRTIGDKSKWERLHEAAVEKYKQELAEYEANKKSDDDD